MITLGLIWTAERVALLRAEYAAADMGDLYASICALPGDQPANRTAMAIHARRLGLRRDDPLARPGRPKNPKSAKVAKPRHVKVAKPRPVVVRRAAPEPLPKPTLPPLVERETRCLSMWRRNLRADGMVIAIACKLPPHEVYRLRAVARESLKHINRE
jgi:hypothetical protein